MTVEDIITLKEQSEKVAVKDNVILYARNIAEMTRTEKRFVLGASPRAVTQLVMASRARAFIEGRDFVKPDDVKATAPFVLGHRLTLTSEAKIAKENKDEILMKLVNKAKVPLE
jgi:MoxR-like ATPase